MIWIFIAPLFIGLLIAIIYPNVSDHLDIGLCASDPQHLKISPDGKLQAVAFTYDCGATTGYSTQVSILPKGKTINSSGNVLVTDGQNRIDVQWLSNTDLIIKNTKGLTTYKQLSSYNGVNIKYRE